MPIKGDFISFSYNGVHSTELGIMRVTSSNRYTDALLPTIQDKTVQASGSDGTYFFGSYYTQRPITINVAFDEVSESQIRLMRKTFGDGLSHELIFDDEPYKVYYAKATGIPQLQYIPFSTPRVYKGEGTFTFTCYDPFAHCKNSQKYLIEFPDTTTDVEMNGNIIGFNNGVENLKKVEVEIEPMQDLHGYSKPWAPGAGKNMYSPSWATSTGASSSVTADGEEIHVVTTGGTTYSGMASQSAHDLPAGTYYVKFKVKTGAVTGTGGLCGLRKRSNHTFFTPTSFSSGTLEYSFSVTTTEPCYFSVLGNGGSTGDSQASDFTLYDLIISTENVDYEPYANICPITGRTSAKIYRFGKNLFNKNGVSSTAVTIAQNSSGFRIVSNANGTYKTCYGGFPFQTLDFPDGTEVTFSAHCKVNSGKARLGVQRVSDNNLVAYSSLVSSGEADLSLTYTYDKSIPVYLSMFCTWSESEAGDVEYTNVQLEIGSTVTSYEPYAGDTYTEDWTSVAGTVYGGTLDVVTGILTVNMVKTTISNIYFSRGGNDGTYYFYSDGLQSSIKPTATTLEVANIYCDILAANSAYNVINNRKEGIAVQAESQTYPGRIYLRISKFASGYTVAQMKEEVGSAQIVYELATPMTYQLSPQEISTLPGQNYIWSNLETNTDIVYKRLTGTTELFKLEWNPSAQLLESKGIYDSYNSSTGFKLYNPGDLEANFKFKVPISASIGGIKIDDGSNHDLESHILMLNGNTIIPKGNDMYLLFNSRTNLIEGLDANGARTMNLYNEYISSGHWFKIPMNESNKTWYFVPINYSGDTPVLEYDYLYF